MANGPVLTRNEPGGDHQTFKSFGTGRLDHQRQGSTVATL